MRKYEIMYIVRPNLEEEGRKAVIANFQNMFTNMGAEIVETKEWGMRDLAYAIEDFTKGYYVVMTVNSSIEAKNEFESFSWNQRRCYPLHRYQRRRIRF